MKKKVLISLLLVIIWMIFIFVMSSMDSNESNGKSVDLSVGVITTVDKITKASDEKVKAHQEESFIDKVNIIIRKSSHAVEYFILGFLILNLFFQMGKYQFTFGMLSILISFLYACTDEYHQTFVIGRTGQFIDVIIDTIGAILGCIIFYLVHKLVVKLKKKGLFNKYIAGK